jgi:aminocarboxymuconate-semialdehyde decarboxylase
MTEKNTGHKKPGTGHHLGKIDIHAHILPEHMPNLKERYGYGDEFIYLDHYQPGYANMMKADGTFFRQIDNLCWDPEAIIDHMDRHKVQMMALSTVPVLFYYWAKPEHTHEWSRYVNDHLAKITRNYPKRFTALGTLPMQDVARACEELMRCRHELNLPGVEIASHIMDRNLDDPYFDPFYETAEKLGMCIFVHPWDMMGQERMPNYFLPWLVGMPAETSLAICSMIFGGVFDRFPKLRVLFAHGGGCFPQTLGRISHAFHARPDLCNVNRIKDPREYLKSFYIDSLVHDDDTFRYLLNLFGPERIALGSDFPFPLGDLEHGRFIELMKDLSQEQKEQLLHKTAKEWLGIE